MPIRRRRIENHQIKIALQSPMLKGIVGDDQIDVCRAEKRARIRDAIATYENWRVVEKTRKPDRLIAENCRVGVARRNSASRRASLFPRRHDRNGGSDPAERPLSFSTAR